MGSVRSIWSKAGLAQVNAVFNPGFDPIRCAGGNGIALVTALQWADFSPYQNAIFVADNRAVFNIKGNRYRLVVVVIYRHRVVYIRFVGTHEEYDQVDVTTK